MRRLLAGLVVIGLLSGCGVFTRPSDTITVERQAFLNAWARAKIIYARAADVAQRACATGQWPAAECARAATLHDQARKLAAEIDAKAAVPESEIDWGRVMKLLEIAVDILA